VLLAGSGNTAHIFDEFAPKLAERWHTYAITRRGYGASSHPASGYDDQRLADDVLRVLDSLRIEAPVLAGHSMAGGELTTLGNQHSDRVSGLVYLDAIADPGDATVNDAALMAVYMRQPLAARSQPPPAFPESEVRQLFVDNADGTRGRYKASTDAIHTAIGEGQKKRDYSGIRVPVLALSTFKCSPATGGNNRCVEHPGDRPGYQPRDAAEAAAIGEFERLESAYISRWKDNLRKTAAGRVRLVDIPRADHHIFLSHEADVLGELSEFLSTL
jgi:pimeloyl-ACP methyl ester carboxylesterase